MEIHRFTVDQLGLEHLTESIERLGRETGKTTLLVAAFAHAWRRLNRRMKSLARRQRIKARTRKMRHPRVRPN